MNVSDMVQRLAALGATAEMIAVAVEALCAEQQKDADRRAKRAEQKRRERGRSDSRATVARQGSDKDTTVVRPPERSPTPPKTNPLTPSETASPQGAEAENQTDPSPALTLKDRLWLEGKPLLVSMGVPEAKAGSMIGRWLRDTEGDPGRVFWAIEESRRQATGDPIPYVTRLLNNSPVAPRGRPNAAPSKDGITTLLSELERRADERNRHGHHSGGDGPDTRHGAADGAYPQRGRGGGAGPVLDLEPIRSDRR